MNEIVVYYLVEQTSRIERETAIRTEGRGNNATVRFKDGGWCPAKDCFLTEQQCRIYHNLPPKDWQTKHDKFINAIQKVLDQHS